MDKTTAIIIGSGIAIAGGFIAIAIYLARRKVNGTPQSEKQIEPLIKTRAVGVSAVPAIPTISTIPAIPAVPAITNEESWDWVDYAGRERKITVHRKVNYG